MRTSLLRIAACSFLFALSISLIVVPLHAAELSWSLKSSPDSFSFQKSDAGTRITTQEPGYQGVKGPGEPILPYRVVSFLLAPGETVASFDVEASAGVVLARDVKPEMMPIETDDGVSPASVMLKAESMSEYPASRAEFLGVGYLHGYSIASFALYPLQIRDGDVVINESMTLHITTGPDLSGTRVTRRLRARPDLQNEMTGMLEDLVVNPEMATMYPSGTAVARKKSGGFQPTSFPSLEGSDVDYVIITNDSLAATFQTLADWKTAKGVPTVVRTTEWIEANYKHGADLAETIRTFIIDAYQDWGITYVLLGGDSEQIPVRLGHSVYLGTKDLPADMYFSCLDGDWNMDHDQYFGEAYSVDNTDLYPEVYTGRLPAVSNATAATLIGKIENYETPVDPSYTGSALLLAEVLFPIDWTEGQSVVQDGADIAEYLYLLALTDPALTVTKYYQNYTPHPGSLPEDVASVIAAMNAGYDQINHTGHGFRFNLSVGNGNVLNSDADALTNTNHYSNLFLLNCTAVAFTYYCIGEHFLLNPNGGAVSVIGAAESVYPLITQPYMNEYYRLLYVERVEHIGDAFARSKLVRAAVAQQGDNADLWTQYAYNMLADPEMQVWTEPVEPLIVSFPPSIGMGTTQVLVNVSDAGGPVQGARVCLSKDEDDYEVGTTDAGGNVTLSMTAESAGSVRIVATALNRGRFDSNITVTPSAGAYVAFDSDLIDDDTSGGTDGNADGIIDAGETIDLTPKVRNTGGVSAANVTLSLRTSTAGVTVVDSVATVGAVGSGGSATATDPFRVVLLPSIADKTPVKFTLTAYENGIPSWTDRFTHLAHAPDIDFDVLRIDDSATGNGDGVVQAGEDFRLYYQIKNFGTGAARGLSAALVDVSGAFTFFDSTDTYGDLGSVIAAENSTGFLLHEADVATPHNLRLDVTDASGRLWQKTFELRPPAPPINILSDPSEGPDRLLLTWEAPAGSTDVDRYRVYRSGAPGGPYELASLDPVLHTLMLDRGLYPTTRYYYRLSSIDISGNESALSPEVEASTNPAQVEGWPITMGYETVSSPVVGDIDGDHDFELVQGDNKIYAWHHNGVEVRDGDGNAQTWGLFSMLGNSYVSHIALADVDSVAGLDILAASRDTQEVYAFSYTGNVIAGWPRPVQNAIRAGIVAADIDGDEEKEIIAIDEAGVLYVWHPDGSEYRDGDNNPATQGVFRTFGGCTYQYGCPAVGDIDGDNINEIVVGTQGDSLFVLNSDGSIVPGWPKTFGSDVAGSVAIGDLDNDGALDVVAHEYDGYTWAFKGDGTTMWSRWAPDYLSFSPSPALGDLDGDGKLEVVIPGKDRNLYAIRWNGTDLPGWPVVYAASLWTESSPVIADIDHDGSLDVILGDENKYVSAWDANGQMLAGFPLATGDAVRATPLVADLDKDGDVEVVVAGWDKTVRVWDFPKLFNPLMAPWAKYHANLYNDGNPTTRLPTPVRGITFVFSVKKDRIELAWNIPPEAGARFSVERAEIVSGVASPYRRVASDIMVSADGVVRLVEDDLESGSRYTFRLISESGEIVNETAGVYIPVASARLGQNFPNPFNPSTQIEYWVPESAGTAGSPVSLVVYDVHGARVRTLVDGKQPAGRYRVEWDGRNNAGNTVATGVYFYRMVTTRFSGTRKMVLLK